MAWIDTSGLSSDAVVAALYNAAAPVDKGFIRYIAEPMSAEIAAAYICNAMAAGDGLSFDYLLGRPLKIRLEDAGFDDANYDHDQGEGTARTVIEILRSSGDPVAPAILALGAAKMADMAAEATGMAERSMSAARAL